MCALHVSLAAVGLQTQRKTKQLHNSTRQGSIFDDIGTIERLLTRSDPMGSDPMGSDPMRSDPIGSDPMGSDPNALVKMATI